MVDWKDKGSTLRYRALCDQIYAVCEVYCDTPDCNDPYAGLHVITDRLQANTKTKATPSNNGGTAEAALQQAIELEKKETAESKDWKDRLGRIKGILGKNRTTEVPVIAEKEPAKVVKPAPVAVKEPIKVKVPAKTSEWDERLRKLGSMIHNTCTPGVPISGKKAWDIGKELEYFKDRVPNGQWSKFCLKHFNRNHNWPYKYIRLTGLPRERYHGLNLAGALELITRHHRTQQAIRLGFGK